jgi:serine O-acetyltransferase
MIGRLWDQLRNEATAVSKKEPLLANFIATNVLDHKSFESCLSFILSNKICDELLPTRTIQDLFVDAFSSSPKIIENAAHDIRASYERDPAIETFLSVILYLKGYQAIQVHRLAHFLWRNSRHEIALFIQSRNAEVFSIDIHPGCLMGHGIMFDHATGIVIGETCVIENNVSILQQVTLGGTGNDQGDRHPKIRSGVLISAGAKVLGNIEIGEGAKIGAGSVVLNNVDAHTTVVGVPARVAGKPQTSSPAETMQQNFLEDNPGSTNQK